MPQDIIGTDTRPLNAIETKHIAFETRTSDPSSPLKGEVWYRSDLTGADQFGELRWYDGVEVNGIPVLAPWVDESQFNQVFRQGTASGVGYAPTLQPADAAYPQLRFQHNGVTYAFHDTLTVYPDTITNRWPIDEGSGTTFADAVGAADGTWTGGTWVSDSEYVGGYGYQLDGVDDYGDTGATNPTGSRTLAGTLEFPNSVAETERFHGWQDTVSGEGAQPGTCFTRARVGDITTANIPSFTVVNDSGTAYRVDATDSVPTNTKTRVVGILDTSVNEIRIAIDGEVVNTASISGAFTSQLSNHKIGRRADSAAEFLNGTVDSVLIDDTAWSGSDLRDDLERQPWVEVAYKKSQLTTSASGEANINIGNFRWTGVVHDGSEQYVTYVTDTGAVMVAERTLPNGDFTAYDTGFTADVTDGHEASVLGIDADGFLHLAWGMHNDPLNYAVSDVANDPSSFTASSMTGNNTDQITYPQFVQHGGNLLFTARNGGNSATVQTLKSYDPSTGSWSDVQNTWVDWPEGKFYLDALRVGPNGNLHATGTFRTSATDPIKHRDYFYMTSSDGGDTWTHADGTTLSTPITRSEVNAFEAGGDMSAQNGLDVDANGYPHVTYLLEEGSGYLQYYHSYWDGSQWTKNQITEYTSGPSTIPTGAKRSRPGTLVRRVDGQVHILYRNGTGAPIGCFSTVIGSDKYHDRSVGTGGWGDLEFGAYDYDRWHAADEVDLYAQPSESTAETAYMLEFSP